LIDLWKSKFGTDLSKTIKECLIKGITSDIDEQNIFTKYCDSSFPTLYDRDKSSNELFGGVLQEASQFEEVCASGKGPSSKNVVSIHGVGQGKSIKLFNSLEIKILNFFPMIKKIII